MATMTNRAPFLFNKVVIYESGFASDGDGAAACYSPIRGQGLDYLENAGSPGDWFGIVCDSSGTPYIQTTTDPYPGFYISCSALQNHSKAINDPARYVDSTQVNYISAASDLVKNFGVSLGDIGICYNRTTQAICYAVIGDISPRGHYGEGSIALAKELGITNTSPKNGGINQGIITVIFLGSRSIWPMSNDLINQIGSELLVQNGGIDKFL